jgi:hypothetical protein
MVTFVLSTTGCCASDSGVHRRVADPSLLYASRRGTRLKKLSIAAVLLLSACASQPSRPPLAPADSEQVRIVDLRDASEKQGKTFSRFLLNSAYGMSRVAEGGAAPTAVRLLQQRAAEILPERPVAITVHHLVTYINGQSSMRSASLAGGLASVGMPGGGSAPKPLETATSSVADREAFDAARTEEYRRALYTEQENPLQSVVYVVYIDTESGGRRVFTRTLAPFGNPRKKLLLDEALEAAVKFHLEQYRTAG